MSSCSNSNKHSFISPYSHILVSNEGVKFVVGFAGVTLPVRSQVISRTIAENGRDQVAQKPGIRLMAENSGCRVRQGLKGGGRMREGLEYLR